MAKSLWQKRGGRYPRPLPPGTANGWGIESDFAGVYALLDGIESRTTNLMGAWPEVGRWFAEREQKVFSTKGRGRWAPRSPSYITALRREALAGRGLLVRSGSLLRASSTATPIKAAPRFAVFGLGGNAHPHQVQIARWLSKGRPSMPRRTAVPGLTVGERRDVGRIVKKHILEEIR